MSTARIGGKIIIIDIGEVDNCGPCPRKHAPALHFRGCFVEEGEDNCYADQISHQIRDFALEKFTARL
jgi:hypothetical protein